MRKTGSFLLIVATAMALLEPGAATARMEETVPACCRPHGKHHCMITAMMAMETQAGEDDSPTISKVREPCPMGVYIRTSGSTQFYTPKTASTAVAVCTSAVVRHEVITFVSTGFCSHTGRGPPTI
jgi:hypothetical protein